MGPFSNHINAAKDSKSCRAAACRHATLRMLPLVSTPRHSDKRRPYTSNQATAPEWARLQTARDFPAKQELHAAARVEE